MLAGSDIKSFYKTYLDAFSQSGGDQKTIDKAIATFFAEAAVINMVHPFNEIIGGANYQQSFIKSLQHAFSGLSRSDYLLMGGEYEGEDWVSSTGYYSGHFHNDWLGIKASNALAYLRVGEFHRMQNGKAIESYVFLDIPELMIACNQWPIDHSPGRERGYTGYLPGPATHDGLLLQEQDANESTKSCRIVTEMLSQLATRDEGWRPYWHKNMAWYGPGAFGSFSGIENFAGFQVTFENAFEGWAGGSAGSGRTHHFTRHGDGNYCCSGGWPSVSGIQIKRFLGQEPGNKMLYMRVCDWWRRDEDLLVENWVFVDIPHVLLQMGYDLFASLKTNQDT